MDLNNYSSIEILKNRYTDTDFDIICLEFTKNEKCFTNQCTLFPEAQFFSFLNMKVDFIKKCDPKKTIYEFLKDDLFLNSTDFFRSNYSNEMNYIDALNGKNINNCILFLN